MRKRWLLLLLVLTPVLIGLAADQVIQHTLLADGDLRGRPIAPFDPPLFNPAQREALERIRAHVEEGAPLATPMRFDAELGWRPPEGGGRGDFTYDEIGARIATGPTPREPVAAGERRLLLVGDSFTHGDEVGPAESWPAQLARRVEGWRTINLGVSAYGVGQALMRYRRHAAEIEADEVWLGVVPAATPRAVSLYRPVLRHEDVSVTFKPRFALDEAGELIEVPNPVRSLADVIALVDDQQRFFDAVAEHDLFVRRIPAAYRPRGTHWTHYLATTRLAMTRLESRDRFPQEWLDDPDSELYRVLRKIVLQMAAEVEATGASFRVLLLPDGRSLRRRNGAGGHRFWARWLEDLERSGVETTDLTDALDAAGVEDREEYWRPLGHYTRVTNGIVAEALAPLLSH